MKKIVLIIMLFFGTYSINCNVINETLTVDSSTLGNIRASLSPGSDPFIYEMQMMFTASESSREYIFTGLI